MSFCKIWKDIAGYCKMSYLRKTRCFWNNAIFCKTWQNITRCHWYHHTLQHITSYYKMLQGMYTAFARFDKILPDVIFKICIKPTLQDMIHKTWQDCKGFQQDIARFLSIWPFNAGSCKILQDDPRYHKIVQDIARYHLSDIRKEFDKIQYIIQEYSGCIESDHKRFQEITRRYYKMLQDIARHCSITIYSVTNMLHHVARYHKISQDATGESSTARLK